MENSFSKIYPDKLWLAVRRPSWNFLNMLQEQRALSYVQIPGVEDRNSHGEPGFLKLQSMIRHSFVATFAWRPLRYPIPFLTPDLTGVRNSSANATDSAVTQYLSQRGFGKYRQEKYLLFRREHPEIKLEDIIFDRIHPKTRVMKPRNFCEEIGKIKTGNLYQYQWKCTQITRVPGKDAFGRDITELVTKETIGWNGDSGAEAFLKFYNSPDLWRPNGGKLEYSGSGPIPVYSHYYLRGPGGKEIPLISVLQFFMKYVDETDVFTPWDRGKDDGWLKEPVPLPSPAHEFRGDSCLG